MRVAQQAVALVHAVPGLGHPPPSFELPELLPASLFGVPASPVLRHADSHAVHVSAQLRSQLAHCASCVEHMLFAHVLHAADKADGRFDAEHPPPPLEEPLPDPPPLDPLPPLLPPLEPPPSSFVDASSLCC